MGASCQSECAMTKTSNCCGNNRQSQMQMMLSRDSPERAIMQKNRRWNEKSKSPLKEKFNQIEDEQYEYEYEHGYEYGYEYERIQINVIDEKLFNKFDTNSKNTIFGYIRDIEFILNEPYEINEFSESTDDESNKSNQSNQRIPNNIHYQILLYYYLMENEFDTKSLLLWNQRANISEFMNTTLQSTRIRMWDKFDKKEKGMLSTQKYLPKFIYTFSVLYLKSKQRGSIPPKYSKVKDCTKYMSSLLIQTLPTDQKVYIDKNNFVDNIHVYLSNIC